MKVGDLVRGSTKSKYPFDPQINSIAIVVDKGSNPDRVKIMWISGELEYNGRTYDFSKGELELVSEI